MFNTLNICKTKQQIQKTEQFIIISPICRAENQILYKHNISSSF